MGRPTDGTSDLIVLGCGYTGRRLYSLGREAGQSVLITSRRPDRHLDYADPAHRLAFDLDRSDTWDSISHNVALIWCFPAEPLEKVVAFAEARSLCGRRIVVLGSTSAYTLSSSVEYPPPWIDETAPIDRTKSRVQGEEFLRKECGAIVLRVAGIYGPGRNPLDWIRQGRVGPSRKFVNLIHVEDLASACLHVLVRGRAGESYNVADGTPRSWASICAVARERWGIIPADRESTIDGPGKRIAITKLATGLGFELRYPNVLASLESSGHEQPGRLPGELFE